MTIIESIKTVLLQYPEGLTAKEIYNEIINKKLYVFGAKNPSAVVNGELRKHCEGIDFPTASPIKHFKIAGYEGKKIKFSICNQKEKTHNRSLARIQNSSEILPEEKICIAFKEYIESVKQQIFECVLNNSPTFFEHLVIDLLLKMGYGYDDDSGIVTGHSHDGGIDGIINEDKLGLDLIYIQAKRYNEKNSVGRQEVQAFVGAMENVYKGVFITTSKFTKEAINFIDRQQKNIKLIDGKLLADLLVKYQVGINTVQTLSLYKIDSDYYNT